MYGIFIPTFTIKSNKHVAKYTSPMDGMGKVQKGKLTPNATCFSWLLGLVGVVFVFPKYV